MDDTTPFEVPVNRRELLKKVAVYTPPVVLAGRALMSPGLAFGKSSSEQSASGPAESSSASSTSMSLPPTSPLSALQSDLALLISVPATGQRVVDKNIAEAVGDLTQATNASWSDNGYMLDASVGDEVFYDLKWAADALNTSGASNSTVASVLADVVAQAGTIANIAVEFASLTTKNAKKAARKLQKGSQRAASGNVRGAVAAYMHAWDIAVVGTECADPDDSDSDD